MNPDVVCQLRSLIAQSLAGSDIYNTCTSAANEVLQLRAQVELLEKAVIQARQSSTAWAYAAGFTRAALVEKDGGCVISAADDQLGRALAFTR